MYGAAFLKITIMMEKERIKFLVFQKQESDQFKRIFDSIDQGLLIVKDDEVVYSNKAAEIVLKQSEGDQILE